MRHNEIGKYNRRAHVTSNATQYCYLPKSFDHVAWSCYLTGTEPRCYQGEHSRWDHVTGLTLTLGFLRLQRKFGSCSHSKKWVRVIVAIVPPSVVTWCCLILLLVHVTWSCYSIMLLDRYCTAQSTKQSVPLSFCPFNGQCILSIYTRVCLSLSICISTFIEYFVYVCVYIYISISGS